ncbi:hypothetical protein ACLOJK_040947 [Asimina triloba]
MIVGVLNPAMAAVVDTTSKPQRSCPLQIRRWRISWQQIRIGSILPIPFMTTTASPFQINGKLQQHSSDPVTAIDAHDSGSVFDDSSGIMWWAYPKNKIRQHLVRWQHGAEQ